MILYLLTAIWFTPKLQLSVNLYTNIKETNYVHQEKQYKKIQKHITYKRESKNKKTNIKQSIIT